MADKKTQSEELDRETTIAPSRRSVGRVEQFRELAYRIASGEVVVPPVLLTGQARREHVRATLREDHALGAFDRIDMIYR